MNHEQGLCLFCIRNTKQMFPVQMVRHVLISANIPTPLLGAPLILPWCSFWCSTTSSPAFSNCKREEKFIPSHGACVTRSCRNLPKHPWDWFIPAWWMLVQIGIFHAASSCPLLGKFQSAFPCFCYYWVRGQLGKVGCLLPPSCVFPGLISGHQAWVTSTFTQKSSSWPRLF